MKKKTLSIKDWAEEDRPREKMLQKGTGSLSDAELIAILISSGNKNETAVELARRILRSVKNNLNALGKLSVKELITDFKGIGEAKAVTICAALELGRRRNEAEPNIRNSIHSSQDAYRLFYPLLRDLPHEELWMILLNRSGKVIENIRISQGGTSETTADLRIILKSAVLHLAAGIILCHNHPSGSTKPSTADDAMTQRVASSAKLLDIRLLDHIIIAENTYYSYADEGRIEN
ncbi:MAG: DNA repair protein RadC [Massilibacteroides sp.]|nr:DNA repair protein RadC [Massilibacteroides sp.]MDD3062170.1 DNA repair protein RadC [Massilibacteroides sp.]MDD4115816.1 DNA repair protein RadC [Massilibacteroides sp.]MDD4660871.1 DNA repair protein RadC [Massilibacteroides sp.]